MDVKNSIIVNEESILNDIQLLYQRFMTALKETPDDISTLLKHELTAQPASLFEPSRLMRKALSGALWLKTNSNKMPNPEIDINAVYISGKFLNACLPCLWNTRVILRPVCNIKLILQ